MIEYFKLLIDFGLLIMVWLVHYSIYPSFQYFSKEELLNWHPKYTRSMMWIAGPLMLAQLGVSIYVMTISNATFIILNLVLVITTWLITFLWAVPLHRSIEQGGNIGTILKKLMKMNRIRAWIWTIIFIWTLKIMTF
ncbi:hypothetical protein [Portibacter lacus]|uniref:hypothetical protein n=1 Tax=Portibacter lacus TaxID=1099794 RepID=UPI001F1CE56C|nr:hypothetical protein [Portibacter lacus]